MTSKTSSSRQSTPHQWTEVLRTYSSDASDNSLMRKFAAHLHMAHQRDPQDATQVLYSLSVRPAPAAG